MIARRVFPGISCLTGHSLIAPYELAIERPFFATILRDPVDRVISHYQANVLNGKASGNFQKDFQNNPYLQNFQVSKITGSPDDLDRAIKFVDQECQFVGLTEKFEVSLNALKRLFYREMDTRYFRKNVSSSNRISVKLKSDTEVVNLIRKYNSNDIALYQHVKEYVFPAMCEKAGVNPDQKIEPNLLNSPFTIKRSIGRTFNKYIYRTVCKIAK